MKPLQERSATGFLCVPKSAGSSIQTFLAETRVLEDATSSAEGGVRDSLEMTERHESQGGPFHPPCRCRWSRSLDRDVAVTFASIAR